MMDSERAFWHILGDDGEPDWTHPVDINTFMRWLDAHKATAHIGRVEARTPRGATVVVSTRYFGWCATTDAATGHPHVWETMILGGVHSGYQRRYSDRRAALAGHTEALALVQRHGVRCDWCLGSGQMHALVPPDPLPITEIASGAMDLTMIDTPRTETMVCTWCDGVGWLAADAPEPEERMP